jgi:hypothetical protein
VCNWLDKNWLEGSCSDPQIFLFVADARRKKFMPQVQMRRYINRIEVAAAGIRDLPRQLKDTLNICFDVYSMLQHVPHKQNALKKEYSEVATEK